MAGPELLPRAQKLGRAQQAADHVGVDVDHDGLQFQCGILPRGRDGPEPMSGSQSLRSANDYPGYQASVA